MAQVNCKRCNGTGYSYDFVHSRNEMCIGCAGSGKVYGPDPPTSENGNKSGCLKNLVYVAFGLAALIIAGALFGENDEDVTTPNSKKMPQQEIRIKKTPPSVIKDQNERTYTVPSDHSRSSTEREESIQFGTGKEGFTTTRQEKENTYPTYNGYPVILENAIGDYTGRAMCKYDNGYIYTGEFKNGSWHGEGTLRYTNGDVYEGDWKNSQRHGQGKFTYADGDYYEGNWKNNLEHGRGILSQDGIITQGRWSKGELKREFDPKLNGP